MTDIHRFSSRRQRLDHAFLAQKLAGAKSYRRIAGYFRSSIFELVGEEIASIPVVQVVCNSELDAADVLISKHARETANRTRGACIRTRELAGFRRALEPRLIRQSASCWINSPNCCAATGERPASTQSSLCWIQTGVTARRS